MLKFGIEDNILIMGNIVTTVTPISLILLWGSHDTSLYGLCLEFIADRFLFQVQVTLLKLRSFMSCYIIFILINLYKFSV